MNLDKTDLKIIKLLQKNSRLSLKHLSEKVFLSQPSVKNRLQRLIDSGCIESFTLKLNYEKLGFKLAFITRISDINISFNELFAFLKQQQELTEIYSVTGSDNYIVKGFVTNTQEMELLLSKLMNYGKLNTAIILESYDNTDPLEIFNLLTIK